MLTSIILFLKNDKSHIYARQRKAKLGLAKSQTDLVNLASVCVSSALGWLADTDQSLADISSLRPGLRAEADWLEAFDQCWNRLG